MSITSNVFFFVKFVERKAINETEDEAILGRVSLDSLDTEIDGLYNPTQGPV